MFSDHDAMHFISKREKPWRVLARIMRGSLPGVKTPGTTKTSGRIDCERCAALGVEEDPERATLQSEFG